MYIYILTYICSIIKMEGNHYLMMMMTYRFICLHLV